MRFSGKVAIVTGAASGIGLATARLLAREGAMVALVDIDGERLSNVVRSSAALASAIPIQCDVSNEADVESCVGNLEREHRRIDILCNNAGIPGVIGVRSHDQRSEEWRDLFEVNLLSCVHFTKCVSRVMMVQRAGAIVNTASIAGLRSSAAGQAYSATKAAMINFSQTCAVDLAEWNIRVNAVCPGLTATGMTKALFDSAKELGREAELELRAPLGRSGTPDDIASAIAFLASDEAGFITGQYLAIDGGKSATMGQFDSGNRSDQLPVNLPRSDSNARRPSEKPR